MNKNVITLIIVILIIILAIVGFVMLKPKQAENDNKQMTERNLQDNSNQEIGERESDMKKENTDKKILVAVFSRADENYSVGTVDVGNTEIMAKNIVEYIGADFFKIEPVNPYPTNYRECTTVAQEEKNSNSRPKIKNEVNNIDDYDTIFIGYPNWWGDMPMIVYTFLEQYDFSGKTIIPFNTHEGSGASGTYTTIKNKLSNSTVLEGLAIRGSEARQDSSKPTIEKWLKELGF